MACLTPLCGCQDSFVALTECIIADEDQGEGEDSDEEDAEVQQAAEAMVAAEVAPPCLDVTLALRYMTQDSRITFHQVTQGCCNLLASHGKTIGVVRQSAAVQPYAAAAA